MTYTDEKLRELIGARVDIDIVPDDVTALVDTLREWLPAAADLSNMMAAEHPNEMMFTTAFTIFREGDLA